MRRKTTEEFIRDGKNLHGEDRYDYRLVNYIDNKTNVNLICSIHGTFGIRPDAHLGMKSGCPHCGNAVRNTTENFIKDAKLFHGEDTYDYSNVSYINNYTKVEIICKVHGSFLQTPCNHYRYGCIKCGGSYKLTTQTYIEKAKEVHGEDTYDYSLVDYVNSATKIKIICKKHGLFEQNPVNHTHLENGCPVCNESKGERRIRRVLENNKITFESQKKFDLMYETISKFMAYDFYLPDYNLCIEYDGEHHFETVEHHYHREEELLELQKRDEIKINIVEIMV
jgi:hypothetical protein